MSKHQTPFNANLNGGTIIKSFATIVLFLFILSSIPAGAQGVNRVVMPHRDELASEISFWKQIFARVSLNEYLIHDSYNLEIVYKKVRFDSTVSDRQRSKELKAIKDEISDLLLRFQSGEFEEGALTPWEREVFGKFAHIRDRNKFEIAARRVRAQQGIKENFLAGVRRSFRYLPHIEQIFEAEGLPHQLVYLPHVESSFNPVARSHVGASGMWQFMRGTARSYMKVNRVADQRFDPLISTRAAARLLKYNYSQLKDWALAITAYNHGLGSMRKAKRRYGDYATIRENYLRRSFGFASKNFYPEFLAVVEISDSLSHYFPNVAKDPLWEFQEITLPKALRLTTFSRQFNIDLVTLKALNPGYHSSVWQGQRLVPAQYPLRLPVDRDAQQIIAALGASREEIQEVTLAQKAIGRKEQLVLTSLRTFFQRRQALRQLLASQRAGVSETAASPNAEDRERLLALEWTAPPLPLAQTTVALAPAAPAALTENPAAGMVLPAGKAQVAAAAPVNPDPLALAEIERRAPPRAASSAEIAITDGSVTGRVSTNKAAVAADESAPPWESAIALLIPAPAAPVTGELADHTARQLLAVARTGVEDQPRGTLDWEAQPLTGAAPQTAVLQEQTAAAAANIPFNKPTVAEDGAADLSVPAAPPVAAVAETAAPAVYALAATAAEPAGRLRFAKPEVGQATRENIFGFGDLEPALLAETPPQPAETRAPASSYRHSSEYPGHEIYASLQKWNVVYNAQTLGGQEILTLLRNRLNVQKGSIIVYPGETLGHFGDWLNINTQSLRRINSLSRQQDIKTGQRLQLDLSRETPAGFLEKRLSYHLTLIESLLNGRTSIRLEDYAIQAGENLWSLARKRNFPVNLLLYFNDLDKLERLYPGDVIKLPVIYN